MYGQRCRVVGRGGGGSHTVRGGLPLLAAQCDLPHPPLRGDLPGPLCPFGKAIHRLANVLVAAADGKQRVPGPVLPRAPDVGVVGLILPGVCVGGRVVRGGGGGIVVSGEEGAGAVYHPGASWCVVVGGGKGVVYVVHEGHVRGGGWLMVVGGGDIARDVVPEVAQEGQPADRRPPFPRHGVCWGGSGCGVGHVGLVVAGAALGVRPPQHGVSDKVSPPIDGAHPDSGPCGGRALAVRGGERRAVAPGDVEEVVEEDVSDTLPKGGHLDEGGRPDALGAAGGMEAQHLLVSQVPEVLPYRCGVV